ncbi:hypothetical protein BU23DRAFT_582091 [Bimuria novae-zelandiae CBS 107.79]|uniref:Serine hydrolase domain-containing protein n=1 Tax=Bimuria novae-zelandiae CBS 107.79 TaxID=1447943 RepID=A0A6A5V006_9PLEO|nr:hypothetical protein BU23DRAFT_582091 [Bimuria novae-zelandiae CBS 107.79]
MKILTLHGLGSSASMLKEKIAPFIKELGPRYQFTFVDGAIPCGRGPGVPRWAKGPFYSYAAGFSPPQVQDALDRLDHFIKEKGPFDGVLGFSLGAALAMIYILDQQARHATSPFLFAVLFSPIFIASPDKTYCRELVTQMLDDKHEVFRAAFPDGEFARLLDRTFSEYLQTVMSMRSMVGMRVRIPTVCVTGEKDHSTIVEQSRAARELCMPSLTLVHTHRGGHDIPFTRSDVKSIASSIRNVAEEMVEWGA